MLGTKNKQNPKSENVVALNDQGEEHLRDKERARRNTRAGVVGATAITLAVGGAAFVGKWLSEDSANTNRSAEKAVAASVADQERYLKESVQEEAEQDEVLQQRMREYMSDLQAGLMSGEVVPNSDVLIIDRGVRVRQTPEFDDLQQSGHVVSPTDTVIAIQHPIIFEGSILVPNSSESEPYILPDGTLNPTKFLFINEAIIGQVDDATGNPFTQKGVSHTDPNGTVSFTPEGGIFMGDESTPNGRVPVSVLTSFQDMESAARAFSAAP